MNQKIKDASIPTIPLNARFSRWFGRNLLRIYMVFGFTYLFIPVAYTFAFSFNDSGKSNLIWKGFTLSNWQNPCGAPEVCNALGNSIKIGLLATVFSTILGTMIAFAIGRYKFKGRSTSNLLIFLPMATPEIVLGASLLSLFLVFRIAGAALLAFSLSFDDFIITNFNSGTLITFPKFVYISAARGIPAQANVIASAMFFLALAIVITAQLVKRKKTR